MAGHCGQSMAWLATAVRAWRWLATAVRAWRWLATAVRAWLATAVRAWHGWPLRSEHGMAGHALRFFFVVVGADPSHGMPPQTKDPRQTMFLSSRRWSTFQVRPPTHPPIHPPTHPPTHSPIPPPRTHAHTPSMHKPRVSLMQQCARY
jgi:hypothetical protein